MTTDTLDLKTRWSDLLRDQPKLRIRDAATQLGVSEVELLATRCGDSVVRLEGAWPELIKTFPRLGEIMCLSRNEAAVHERYGTFTDEIAFFHGFGQITGPDIDLRLFMSHWHFGFAVTDATDEGPRRSFHFFDADGTAIHKIFLNVDSNAAVFDEIVAKYRSANQADTQLVLPAPKLPADRPDSAIDVEGFQKGWLATGDTHEFFGLLKKFGVGRHQALRLAPQGYSQAVSIEATQKMLEAASAKQVPIMVFVGSPGCLQIHTGPVTNIKRFGGNWINVLDDKFNFHLNETLVANAWAVRKATRDGDVTSLELFDAQGENLVLFFGKRKPGEPEDPAWRAIVAELPVLS